MGRPASHSHGMCGVWLTYLARGAAVLFATFVLALSVPPMYLGGVFLNRGSTQFLATPLPTYLPWALIGASLLLLVKFVVTIRGACSPADRKLSLALAMIVTLILMTLSACAVAMCFEVQRSIVQPDSHNVFVGHFFSAVRHRFERMFSECEPFARTLSVLSWCRSHCPGLLRRTLALSGTLPAAGCAAHSARAAGPLGARGEAAVRP